MTELSNDDNAGSTTLPAGRILAGAPLSAEEQARVLDEFYRQGFSVITNVLSADEISHLRELGDKYLDDSANNDRGFITPVCDTQVLRSTQALHPSFCDMLVREPFLSLAGAILGPNPAFCGQNIIRSEPGTAISLWHVDDILEFPLPDDVPRHDARIRMPVFWFSFQIALSEIDAPEFGPTEVVPRSHYSGRPVPKGDSNPTFEGQGPVPILCRAGDVYLFNHQLWHHGAKNRSDRRRYLMQNQYCKSWGPYRFNSIDAIKRLPEEEMHGMSEKVRKFLEPTRLTPW